MISTTQNVDIICIDSRLPPAFQMRKHQYYCMLQHGEFTIIASVVIIPGSCSWPG